MPGSSRGAVSTPRSNWPRSRSTQIGSAPPARGASVVVGLLAAGHQSNVVPASGRLELDVRASSAAELRRVREALLARPALAGGATRVEVLVERGPLEPDAATASLLACARELGAEVGLEIAEGDRRRQRGQPRAG